MPKPENKETEKEYLKRCIPELINEGYPQKQSVAICFSTYRKYGTVKNPQTKKISPNTKRKIFIAHY